MPKVLVVVDAVDGSTPKPALELLTLARRIGLPAVAPIFDLADFGIVGDMHQVVPASPARSPAAVADGR